MMRYLLAAIALVLLGGRAAAEGRMPDYFRDLDRPYHAGDWTLQCDSSRVCQIVGAAKVPRSRSSRSSVRAIVMIGYGKTKNAKPTLRLAFVDSMRVSGTLEAGDEWRLYSQGLQKKPPPIRLSLDRPDADAAYRVAPEIATRIISALQRWPGLSIRERGQVKALMPRGNLARLQRRMERLQHPRKPRITAEEAAKWLKQYHYVTLRALPADTVATEDFLLSCDARTHVNRPEGARVGPQHHLWTGDCPEGHKVFLQHDRKNAVMFNLHDKEGKVRPHSYAGFDRKTSLLEILLPINGNDGCGDSVKFGFTGQQFVMIDHRRYHRCRMVPDQFWPRIWHPTTWKQIDQTPSNGGNAPPVIEGVEPP